jgi:predicted nucleic acid-binding protein
MTDKVFVDSNILIYAHDLDAGRKREVAAAKLSELWDSEAGRLSTQVLQEFYVNVTRKLKTPIERGKAREVVRAYAAWVHTPITPATILRASEIGDVWQLSFWDSMILASAEELTCDTLLSEDLNDGQVVAGVAIVNPFR